MLRHDIWSIFPATTRFTYLMDMINLYDWFWTAMVGYININANFLTINLCYRPWSSYMIFLNCVLLRLWWKRILFWWLNTINYFIIIFIILYLWRCHYNTTLAVEYQNRKAINKWFTQWKSICSSLALLNFWWGTFVAGPYQWRYIACTQNVYIYY